MSTSHRVRSVCGERSDCVICARRARSFPIDKRLECDRAQQPLVLLLHLVPNLVYDVRSADSIRMRVGFLIDAIESRQDGMDRDFGRWTGQLMAAQRPAGTPDQTSSTQCPQ